MKKIIFYHINMIKKFTITLILFLLYINVVFAHIDVVYPTKQKTTINSESTFFVGNTTKNSTFKINEKRIKLWNNNFFVHVVPLKFGNNQIKLESTINGKTEQITYEIYRNKLSTTVSINSKSNKKNDEEVWYTKTINKRSTVREKSTKKSNRVVDLQENIILYLDEKKGEYYKINESGKTDFWIHESNIQKPVSLSLRTKATLKKTKEYEDEKYKYTKFYLSHPVLYTIEQNENSVVLTLFGVKTEKEDGTTTKNTEYKYTTKDSILGYDGFYEENTFILRIAKTPKIKNEQKPLTNIAIFLDAGHGGSEKGAIGPTRILEKDINLEITKYLKEELLNEGAKVITSRDNDKTVDLYERVEIAKDNNALISISIHNNSLPNGKDPYERHGTEVHYYNENAKILADIIQTDLVENLKIKDGGINKSSFVLTRETNPVSVLVEVAYMINPQEYIELQKPEFQKNVAISIKNSIKKYINIMTKDKNVI